jgi:excisionase family DNA binding protein
MTPTQPTEQRLFDISAAVAYLRGLGATAATPNLVRTLIASGSLPHLRLGKKFYVSKAAIDLWLSRSERRLK